MRKEKYKFILFVKIIGIISAWGDYSPKIRNLKYYIVWNTLVGSKNRNVFTTDFFICRNLLNFRCRGPPQTVQLKNFKLNGGIKLERPKRRKSKDNPYTLIKTNNQYFVIFKDNTNTKRVVEVNEKVFLAFDGFELEDKSQMNKDERHIEQSEVYEDSLVKRAKFATESLEDEIIRKSTFEDVRKAIEKLSDIQKRRIIKYFFEDKNEYEIAAEEGTSHQVIHIALERAKEKLKEILKNYKN